MPVVVGPLGSDLRRGADRGNVPQIMEESMRFLRVSSFWTRLMTPVVVLRQVLGVCLSRKLWKFYSCSSRTGGDMPVVVRQGMGVPVPRQCCLHARCVQKTVVFHSSSFDKVADVLVIRCSEVPQVQLLRLWSSL